MRSTAGFIELFFGPQWKYISCVRTFVQSFLSIGLPDPAKADKVALAASELLENAVKYSDESGVSVKIEVAQDLSQVDIAVANKAPEESIAALKQEYETIMKGDALEAYIKKMREAGSRQDGRSRLGLARIRYETGGSLTLRIEKNMVRLKLVVKME